MPETLQLPEQVASVVAEGNQTKTKHQGWFRLGPKPVAIFGSGPAGLLAAHALALAGKEFDIFALGEPSKLVGPQYLYQHIPEVTNPEPEGYVTQVVRGTMTDYRRKLYGAVDPGWIERAMAPGYDAWNLRAVYERLWLLYEHKIQRLEVSPVAIGSLLSTRLYKCVISTIPATAICNGGHRFQAWSILIADRMVEPIPDNTIVFNGESSPSWVRESNIWGTSTTEWPTTILDPTRKRSRPPVPDMYEFEKPLRTDCDCWAKDVIRMGRFGKWRNETWAHDAFNEATQLARR